MKILLVIKCIQPHTLIEKYGDAKKMNKLKIKTEKPLFKIKIAKNYNELHQLQILMKTKRTEVRTAIPSLWSWIMSLLNSTYNI